MSAEELNEMLSTPGLMSRAVLEECAWQFEQRQQQQAGYPNPEPYANIADYISQLHTHSRLIALNLC